MDNTCHTRPSNKDAHPGLAHLKLDLVRRSPLEVAFEKREHEKQLQAIQNARKSTAKRITTVQATMKARDDTEQTGSLTMPPKFRKGGKAVESASAPSEPELARTQKQLVMGMGAVKTKCTGMLCPSSLPETTDAPHPETSKPVEVMQSDESEPDDLESEAGAARPVKGPGTCNL